MRATGNVPELCGHPDSDQHVRSTTSVHTQSTAVPLQPLQFGSQGRRPEDSAADLLPTCGQVRRARARVPLPIRQPRPATRLPRAASNYYGQGGCKFYASRGPRLLVGVVLVFRKLVK